jgi:TRAP transporter 4TM/12TM fusion protein
MVAGYTPMFAAFYAIISILLLSMIRKETRMSAVQMLSAFEEGARQAVSVSVACAAAGIIIGCVFVSGLGLKFSTAIVDLAGGHLVMVLVLTMFASLILGMGLTTTAVYITLAALVIPSLVNMGVEPIAAHLFAFYFGLVSAITPPVALASFAAAGVANAPPMLTGIHSFRLGIAKYILPFVFVYNPAMLFAGDWFSIVTAVAGGFAGIYALTVTTEGWMIGPAGWPLRLGMAAAAGMMFHPDKMTDLAGWVVFIALILLHRQRVSRAERTEVKT